MNKLILALIATAFSFAAVGAHATDAAAKPAGTKMEKKVKHHKKGMKKAEKKAEAPKV
ncbi:hypothetical protein [Chitinimonas sp. BJB300]|uniref:hypothetical protein n=1 Tax=Chitinimonas sp. BJB300 TaxID=1559339 RepID=UPI001642669A|nr:hypothetical protein [Chitinimonas sp. BJB300]